MKLICDYHENFQTTLILYEDESEFSTNWFAYQSLYTHYDNWKQYFINWQEKDPAVWHNELNRENIDTEKLPIYVTSMDGAFLAQSHNSFL